jgi:hypothetical protein
MRLMMPLFLLACGGAEDSSVGLSSQDRVPDLLLQSSWQVQVASPEVMGNLAAKSEWKSYFNHDYAESLQAFSSGDGAARIHAELAGLYRQAAMIQAHAIQETYGPDQIREGDPQEVAYLLGVANWIAGDSKGVKDRMADKGVVSSTVAEIRKAASAWSDADFDPKTTEVFSLGDVTVGAMAPAAKSPHYLLPEQIGEGVVEVSDPTEMIKLAHWHESAAIKANPAAGRLLDLWGFPWAEPIGGASLGLEGLFLGPWMSDAEVDFVRAIRVAGNAGEAFELQEWTSKSAYAAALSACVSKEVDAECVLDRASSLQSQLQGAMETAAGEQTADHQMLAKHARVGLIRAAARLAQTLGDVQGEGRLRLAGLDASSGTALDPLYQLSMAAWDTQNRNPHRAQSLLHGQVSRAPGLDAARISLNVLYLRVSRDAGDGIPMH